MSQTAKIVPLPAALRAIESALVTGTCDEPGCIRIRTTDTSMERLARMAVYPCPVLAPGDEVLSMTDDNSRVYIVGILSCAHDCIDSGGRLHLNDGSFAEIERSGTGERLKVYNRTNQLVVDYHTGTNTVTINSRNNDLAFAAGTGSVIFQAAKEIVLNAPRVRLDADADIDLQVNTTNGGGSSLSMSDHRIQLASPDLDITSRRTRLFFEEIKLAGKTMLGRIADVRVVTRKIESVADTVMAKARNVYRTVSELCQLKAGRQRTLIENSCHVKARKTILKSESDFKVKAEKIHLG